MIAFDAIVNGLVFLILFSNFSCQVYRETVCFQHGSSIVQDVELIH